MNNVVPPAADIAREFPNQLACIFIRNITADYSDHKNPLLNVERTMEGIPQSKWFVYDSLENLLSLDIQNGTCHPIGKENQQTWSGGWEGVAGASTMMQLDMKYLVFIIMWFL